MITLILKIRAWLNRQVFKKSKRYFVPVRSLKPISRKFGFDRGVPIDRYWIESFLQANSHHIKGHVLEITDSKYTSKFGKGVILSDVLDIDKKNKKANIHGDLRNLKGIVKDNTYDCVILTHVLGLIDDCEAAISECYRILKPGGVVLFTSSCLGFGTPKEKIYWRFTRNSIRYLLEKYFNEKKTSVFTYGNVLAGQFFWVGMAQEDLSVAELEFNDPNYPCIVTAVSKK